MPILSTVVAAIAPTAVEATRVRLGKHGEPLDVGTGRHAARARKRTFDLACVVPDSGSVTAGRESPSRACKGCSSRLHTVTRLLQLDVFDGGGSSATRRRSAESG